ncbi:hypothetical protein AYL99_06033 [Fonsecaea erecta]|uniref:Uncharacterized protein n=1 Tax=Fonsecaea erecta TaxID=1367422 RepID=A0A178ZMJ6_9EURO|nr:hypothetical protein AYL99_06033 [Fonsecaea erecta]OAP61029.1 hypothetical protein AYL99_06033 [Fonsecaea erecta]
MAVFSNIGAVVTTVIMMMVANAPSTAMAMAMSGSSTAPSGSYTLCQFWSSVPGLSSTQETSMTLPLCPSSLLTFSYTIPPTATATPTTTQTTMATTTLSPSVPSSTGADSGSYTLCQFYSSIPGLSSSTAVSSMTLPSCPASLQDITYSYQAPLGTSLAATATTTSSTAASSAAAAASSFTGAAAPRHGLDRMVLGGMGGILAGAVGMML